MNRERFVQLNERHWNGLESLLGLLEAGKTRVGSVEDFPALYRRVCHHLALVRHRRYGADLEARLNRLVMRGHRQLYRRRGRVGREDGVGLARLVGVEIPRRVRAEAKLVLLATLLFFGPLVVTYGAVLARPELAFSIMSSEQIEGVADQYGPSGSVGEARPLESNVLMFGYYIYNNVSIAFRTFAAGIFFGVGSIFFLLYNGLAIGAVAGYVHRMGFQDAFFPFVVGHGAFELTAIVLAGAAGLRIGLALLAPGRLGRLQALRRAAGRALPVLACCAVMLVVAAFVEAFWSPSTIAPPSVKYLVGALLWTGVLAYFATFGRTVRR